MLPYGEYKCIFDMSNKKDKMYRSNSSKKRKRKAEVMNKSKYTSYYGYKFYKCVVAVAKVSRLYFGKFS